MDATPARSFITHKNAGFEPISPGSPFSASPKAPEKSPHFYQCILVEPFGFLSCPISSTAPSFNSRPFAEVAPSPPCPGMVPGAGYSGFPVRVTSPAQENTVGAAAAGGVTWSHDHRISEG